jgi:hypothetical protein
VIYGLYVIYVVHFHVRVIKNWPSSHLPRKLNRKTQNRPFKVHNQPITKPKRPKLSKMLTGLFQAQLFSPKTGKMSNSLLNVYVCMQVCMYVKHTLQKLAVDIIRTFAGVLHVQRKCMILFQWEKYSKAQRVLHND